VWTLVVLLLAMQTLPRPTRLRISQPLQAFLLAPLRLAASLNVSLSDVRQENHRLSHLATELAVENARLQASAAVQVEPLADSLPLVRAPIIARDLATFERYLVISRGLNKGIRLGNPVITQDGVVGKIVSVSPHQALVQTVLASDARVAVMSLRSRTPGITRPVGTDELSVDYLPKEADYRVGDTVVTAGLGEVFPKGLRVGVVVSAPDDEGALFKPVLIQPLVQLARLEAVYVLCLPETPLPAAPDSESVRRDSGRYYEWIENVGTPEVSIPEDGGAQ